MNDEILRLLRADPVWCAYALADLNPRVAQYAEWHHEGEGLLLLFRQFETPILFANAAAGPLLARVKDDAVSLQVPASLEAAVRARFASVQVKNVVRMWLPKQFAPVAAETLHDAAELEALYATGEAPDFFHAWQVADGFFRGLRDAFGRLIAAAGTHTVFAEESAATIGNVYVHPEHRGRGLGERVVQATAAALQASGIKTIALNVREHNLAAVRLYHRMGFAAHSMFLEGSALGEALPHGRASV